FLSHQRTAFLLVAWLLLGCTWIGPAAYAGNWPGWRGDGSGVSRETSLPHTWSSTENVRWVAPIPGDGLSSPIVWGDRVFLTTAVYEPDGHLPTFVLLAFLAVLVPLVLISSLDFLSVHAPHPAPRLRRL